MSSSVRSELLDKAQRVAKETAGVYADDVDRNARFPVEAIDALRRERLLGILVPEALSGQGAQLVELSGICEILGRSCASTAMIYAMHLIQVACIVRHGKTDAFRAYLTELVERQRLIASATSEVGIGGDMRQSRCAIERDEARFQLKKDASVISYGASADDILVTARRHPDAVASDQVLALLRRNDFTLEPISDWDTLGMRGTCSLGFKLASNSSADQILPAPFADIAAQTMVPFSHILWASVWLGIASEAVRRARSTVQNEARKKPGTLPGSAARLAELENSHQVMRSMLCDTIEEYTSRMHDPDALASLAFAVRMNNLKISASVAVVDIVSRALSICGIAGYRLDTPVSLGRYLRDAYSAGVMILNDRLYKTNSTLLLAVREN
jgi:acyl-CoA dehydrogenase